MSTLPAIMGIINVTPDSFYEGSRANTRDQVLKKAAQMIAEGADWLDIGGESTRPGALQVSAQEEAERVLPYIEALQAEFPIPLSIDTSKPQVMKAAIERGVNMINDVKALQEPDALSVVANSTVKLCLMHMQGEPATMQHQPYYEKDIILVLQDFFAQRLAACAAQGIERQRIILDPGIGFGKNLAQNTAILNRLNTLSLFQLPILIGVSRKTMLGEILQKPADERLSGSLAATMIAVERGAQFVRTHDVGSTRDALLVMHAIFHEKAKG